MNRKKLSKLSSQLKLEYVTDLSTYERDEVKPSIDVVKRLVDELGTTAGYLLGETSQINILKNPEMLQRLNEVDDLPEEDKSHTLYAIDGLVRDVKTRKAYSKKL